MGKKKQQSIDTHITFAGESTRSKHDAIELLGREDDATVEISEKSAVAVRPHGKIPTTRRAAARMGGKDESDEERNRREEDELKRALEESRQEKEREDRRNRQRERENTQNMEARGNNAKGSGELTDPVTAPGETPISLPPVTPPGKTPITEEQLGSPSTKVPVPRPLLPPVPRPLLPQVPRSPLLPLPMVTLERISVPPHCSPLLQHPPPSLPPAPLSKSEPTKETVPVCGKTPVGQRGRGEPTSGGGVSTGDQSEGSGGTKKDGKQKALSLRRLERSRKDTGSAGGVEAAGSGTGEGDDRASPCKGDTGQGERIREPSASEGWNKAGTHPPGGQPPPTASSVQTQGGHTSAQGGHTSAQGGHTSAQGGHTSAQGGHTSAQGGHTSAQGGHTSAQGGHTPAQGGHTSAQPINSKLPPPRLYAPPGTPSSQYTSVILGVFDDYIKQLEAIQSRQLVRVPWGPPITTKAYRDTPTSTLNTREVWSLPYRKPSYIDNQSDEEIESRPSKPPPQPSKPPPQPIRSTMGMATSKDALLPNFVDSSDEEFDIQGPSSSHPKPTYTITTITPTKINSRAVATTGYTEDAAKCSPSDKDVTPPLSGGEPFEYKGEISPPVLKVSSALTRDTAAASPKSTWLTKRGATPVNRGKSGLTTPKNFSLGRKRKLARIPDSSSFDELMDDVAKRHKTSLPNKAVPPHTIGTMQEEGEEEEEESMESGSSQQVAVPATSGGGVIDLTGDSQTAGNPSKTMRACPMCGKPFAQAVIEDHASTCLGGEASPSASPAEVQKVRSTSHLPSSKVRVVSESSESSSREFEVLDDDDDEAVAPSPKTSSSPRLYQTSEGGFIVDMDTVSNSPIKSFVKIGEQESSEFYYQPFASSEGDDHAHRTGQGQRSQRSHKRGTKWKGRGGGRKQTRGRGKGSKFVH